MSLRSGVMFTLGLGLIIFSLIYVAQMRMALILPDRFDTNREPLRRSLYAQAAATGDADDLVNHGKTV